MVCHGHVQVNDKRVTIPSFSVRTGTTVQVTGSEKFIKTIKESLELAKERPLPTWLQLAAAERKGKVVADPKREDVQFPIQESLIVELYSK